MENVYNYKEVVKADILKHLPDYDTYIESYANDFDEYYEMLESNLSMDDDITGYSMGAYTDEQSAYRYLNSGTNLSQYHSLCREFGIAPNQDDWMRADCDMRSFVAIHVAREMKAEIENRFHKEAEFYLTADYDEF